MRWHVLGAGALGSVFATAMAAAGLPVTLLLRDAAALAEYRRQGGLTVKRDEQDTLWPLHAECATSEAGAGDTPGDAPAIEALLVTTKAQQVRPALQALRGRLAPDAIVLLLHNGLGVVERLAPLLPPGVRLLQGSSTEGAWRRDRFHSVHAGSGETRIGSARERGDERDAAGQVIHALSGTALYLNHCEPIAPVLWRKLAVNSVINPLTTLLRCRNGELAGNTIARRWQAALLRELNAVATARGHGDWLLQIDTEVDAVIRGTAANRSSMLQDVLAGRTTEIDFINGFVVQAAMQAGVSAPAHRSLLQAVSSGTGLPALPG